MKQVMILTGLSGSGKSTLARQYCVDHTNWLRVNRDDLRRSVLSVSLHEYWKTWPLNEQNRVENLVNELQKTALLDGLARGWHMLIDNTNLKLSYLNEFRTLLTDHFAAVTIHYRLLDTPLDECIRRDRNRSDSVGEAIIRKQAHQLTNLKRIFQFKPETLIRETAGQRPQDARLPRCILVDIDGTVAERSNRSPFDWHRVGLDSPRWPIIRLVQAMRASGYTIVFVSGRDAVCRPETMTWLDQHFQWQPSDYVLYMRPASDSRKDMLIKRELFEQHIQDRYYVEFVIDDRQQVVDLWRRTLGLTCLQVDYGNF